MGIRFNWNDWLIRFALAGEALFELIFLVGWGNFLIRYDLTTRKIASADHATEGNALRNE